MDTKTLNRAFAFLAFAVTLVVYAMTVQPSVPFWDCGEFTAGSIWQQVPHPPGAPLFLMVGKLFSIIIPFGDLGWRVNMVSVFATAFSVLFLYLITVKAIENFRGKKYETFGEAISVYGSALVGALAFCFTDTIWFNGVESEVYAASTLFTAVVVYLMMRWNEEADNPGHERYLLLIAYLIGLSTGVHLLAILTVFSIVMLVYFRKYKVTPKSFIIMGVIALVIFFVIYQFVVMWLPTMLAGDSPFKNAAKERIIENSPVMTMIGIGIILLAAYGFWYGVKRQKPILKLVSGAFLLILFGFTTYFQVLIRSNSNSPMNENEPKNFSKLISYLGREQYGDAGNWPRRTDFNDEGKMYYYNLQDEKGKYVYGEWTAPESKRVERKDGQAVSMPDWTNVNISGELAYLWKYQIKHMYFRYFFWNYVGKLSDIQDSDEAWFDKGESELINYKSGYGDQFPVRFFAIPLLFGLIGLYFQFKKDPKTALVYFTMFLLTGVLAAIAQNQQNPQPRERDYFYAGSFMVWCMWIGTGTYTLIDWLVKNKKSMVAPTAVVMASILLVPFNMGLGGWNVHTRAGNYIPFDYSYNILQSCAQDAILFTNGDNDTFPLWYLQDVEGVRRDVRVVNLSLGQTLWYIDQLKNREPWGAKKIPLSFPDEVLHVSEDSEKALSYDFGEPQNIIMPVSRDILKQYTNDTALINDGNMRFTYVGKPFTEKEGKKIYVFHVNNKLVLDILKQTKFERPVYFSTTVGPDVFSGLGRHLRYEGMALRVCPVPNNSLKTGQMEPNIMAASLLNIDNSDNYHKEQHYGFKFRNLDNKSYYYYDEVHRRLMANYRQLFTGFASYTLETMKDTTKCVAIIDTMNKYLSTYRFPLYHQEESQLATLYHEAGAKEQAKQFAQMTIKSCTEIFNKPALRRDRVEKLGDEIKGRHGTYKAATDAYLILGNYDAARTTMNELYELCKQAIQGIQGNDGYKNEFQQVQKNVYDILGNMAGIDDAEIRDIEKQGKKKEALEKAESLLKKYNDNKDPLYKSLGRYIEENIRRLKGEPPPQMPETAAN